MDAVGREEPVLDALLEAVGVQRVAKVGVGVSVVVAKRSRRHAELGGGLEVFEDFAPVAVVARAASMTLVHDHEVEEVRAVLPIEARTVRVARDRLVGGEVHLAAQHGFALDLVPGVAEGSELLVLRVVDEDVPVGQVEHARPPVFAAAIPASLPEPPADLEGDEGLARARGQGQEDALLALQDRLDRAIDGDLLVVARGAARSVVVWRDHPLG